MTDYYVRKTGSDGAAGTSPGAAWATIGKALGASGISSGDTVYIGAGVYRECVTVAMTSATVETFVIGDTDGSHTGDAGEVQWTAFTTNDKTAPAGAYVLDLAGRDYLTFRNLSFVGAYGWGGIYVNGASTNITISDCTFLDVGAGVGVYVQFPFGTIANWLVDRCRILTSAEGVYIELASSGSGADYDVNFVVRNSLIISTISTSGTGGVSVVGTGADDTFRGGGVVVRNCTIIAVYGVTTYQTSSTYKCLVYNNVLHSAQAGVYSALERSITEDYNVFLGGGTQDNVTPGAHSIYDWSYAPLIHIGQELQYGATLRPFGMPTAGSPLLGFGGTTPPAVDILNAPRPAGGESALTAVGAYERNTFTRETGTVRSGSNAISIIGPGYKDEPARVDPVETTISAWFRWDSTYAGTKPKLQVLNAGECGVADDEATAVGGANSWEQLSLTFTPTAKGIVRVRFLSSDTNGGGKMIVDDLLRMP